MQAFQDSVLTAYRIRRIMSYKLLGKVVAPLILSEEDNIHVSNVFWKCEIPETLTS